MVELRNHTKDIKAVSAFTLSSAATALGVMYPTLWFLVVVGLAGFLCTLYIYAQRARTALVMGWMYGTITTAASLAWFWHMTPFDWLGSASYLDGALFAGSMWLLTSLLLGIATALFAGVTWLMRDSFAAPYLTPMLFALSGVLSMWLHTIIALGQESLVEPHFSAPSLGYALTEQIQLLQLAESGGIDSLNFFLAAIAMALSLCVCSTLRTVTWRTRVHAYTYTLLVALCITLSISIDSTTSKDEGAHNLDILILSASDVVTPHRYTDMRNTLSQALSELDTPPHIIIFPESFSLEALFGNDMETQAYFKKWFQGEEVILVYTKIHPGERAYNSIYFHSSTRGVIHEHQKRYLAPEGEYTTYLGHLLIGQSSDPLMKRFFEQKKPLVKGPLPSAVTAHDVRIGALSCYEIFSPYLFDGLVREHGAELLINTSNPSWFHGSRLYFDKTVAMSKVHAVQHRVPIVVTNQGTASYVVDRDGEMVSITPWNTTTHASITLTI